MLMRTCNIFLQNHMFWSADMQIREHSKNRRSTRWDNDTTNWLTGISLKWQCAEWIKCTCNATFKWAMQLQSQSSDDRLLSFQNPLYRKSWLCSLKKPSNPAKPLSIRVAANSRRVMVSETPTRNQSRKTHAIKTDAIASDSMCILQESEAKWINRS